MIEKEKSLQEITKDWTNALDTRVCAVCLCEVKREAYDEHITKVHGFTIITIGDKND